MAVVWDEIPAQRAALEEVAHHGWPLPDRPWLMGQTWRELLFAHWRVDPQAVRRVVPPQLELDLREGDAWVGVTPFRITGLRGQGMPPIPGLSSFLEVNVRTYVIVGGRPGIYFFSLDASTEPPVFAARRGYRLPYFRAEMSATHAGGAIHYRSRRVSADGPPAELDVTYEASGPPLPVKEGSLERWLAERYCLYTLDDRGRVLRGDIHHTPWPLQPASASFALNRMGEQVGLGFEGDPVLHYSHRLDTLLWPLDAV